MFGKISTIKIVYTLSQNKKNLNILFAKRQTKILEHQLSQNSSRISSLLIIPLYFFHFIHFSYLLIYEIVDRSNRYSLKLLFYVISLIQSKSLKFIVLIIRYCKFSFYACRRDENTTNLYQQPQYYIISRMGNKVSPNNPDPNRYPQLQHHSTAQHPRHGPCQVYISNKLPSCYIIKIVSPVAQQEGHPWQMELFGRVENEQNVYLLGLFGCRVGKVCGCGKEGIVCDSVVSYWEYLPYSLAHEIQYRRKQGTRFQQPQLWHLIKACTHGYATFHKLQIYYNFMPSHLMINREGRIRLDWMHIEEKNMHAHYIVKVAHNETEWVRDEEYLAPEECQTVMLKQQFTPKISFQSSNIFSLGVLLLHCMTLLEPPAHFYQHMRVNYAKIEKIMGSELRGLYSEGLLVLVGRMLSEGPEGRPGFQEVATNWGHFLDKEFSIHISGRVYGGQGRNK